MELVILMLIMMVLGFALFSYFTNVYVAHDSIIRSNQSITQAREPIDALADHLRNAQSYTDSGSATYYPPIVDGQASEVTYRTGTSSIDSVRYFLDGTNIKRTDSTGTRTIATDVQSLYFTYMLAPKYNFSAYTYPVASTLAPAERSLVSAIEITATMTVDGESRTFSTIVKLRNSPRKTGV